MTLRQELTLSPSVAEVSRLNAWLDAAFATSGVVRSVAADLKLCLNEIVANLISYAFASTAAPRIVIAIELDRDAARAEVRDNGSYFDIRDYTPGPPPTTLESARVGGYGIMLIRDRARSIAYDSDGAMNRLSFMCCADAPDTGQPGR